jgi:hypothetical protein
MQTVTLKAEDFKTVHNTLCELREIEMRLNEVINEQMAQRLHRVIKGFELGLADAYAQDNAEFESKMDYYGQFQTDNGLAAIWSVYDLPAHGFLSDHPFPSDAFVVYHGYHVPVYGETWGDVYRAADRCIELSGDDHHIFIEHFEQVGNELRLTTGS